MPEHDFTSQRTLTPLNGRVLIRVTGLPHTIQAGLIIMPGPRHDARTWRDAYVVALPKTIRLKHGERAPLVEVGDRVIVSVHAGVVAGVEDRQGNHHQLVRGTLHGEFRFIDETEILGWLDLPDGQYLLDNGKTVTAVVDALPNAVPPR